MEVSRRRNQQELRNAAATGTIAAVGYGGYQIYKQKNILKSPEEFKALEKDVLELESRLQDSEGEKGVSKILGKIADLSTKAELSSKKDMLESLSKKEISYKGAGKAAAFFALNMAAISLVADKVIDLFRGKKD